MGGIEDIIARHGTTNDTVEITIRGEKFVLRTLRTAGSVVSVEKIVSRLVKACENKMVDPEALKYLPQSPDVLRLAGWMIHVIVEPMMNLQQALRLAQEAGPFFLQLGAEIMTGIGMTANEQAEEEVDAEGEDFGVAVGGQSGPSLPETCTEPPSKN